MTKYILQKDIPERMTESNFGLKHLRNDISLINIQCIFKKKKYSKPTGFWYSLKWFWLANQEKGFHYDQIDYSIDNNREYYVNENWFLYDIQIDDKTFTHIGNKKGLDKIIQIQDYKDMVDFYEEYKHPESEDDEEFIDWKKVYMDYGGIELAVTHHEKYLGKYTIKWWAGWDIASGCVWNGDVIKKIRWIL